MELFEPAFDHTSPGLEIPTIIGSLILTHFDTRIRTFADNQYDHIEHKPDDRLLAMQVSREVIDLLFENEFPYLFLPYVDEATLEWFIKLETKELDNETFET